MLAGGAAGQYMSGVTGVVTDTIIDTATDAAREVLGQVSEIRDFVISSYPWYLSYNVLTSWAMQDFLHCPFSCNIIIFPK